MFDDLRLFFRLFFGLVTTALLSLVVSADKKGGLRVSDY